MTIAPLAEPVSMSARLKQFQKAIFIRLTRMFALTAEPALTFVRLRQFTLSNRQSKKIKVALETGHLFLFP
jgi:hypothetical protein